MITTNDPMTFQDLFNVPLLAPQRARRYWMGVPHCGLIEAVEQAAITIGWRTGPAKVHLNSDSSDMACTWDVALPMSDVCNGHPIAYALGMQNSNARNFAMRMFLGVRLLENDIGIPLVNISLGKHTLGFALPTACKFALSVCDRTKAGIPAFISQAKQRQASQGDCTRLAFRAAHGRSRLLPWSRLKHLDDCLSKIKDPTAWDLVVCFAEASKLNPPLQQMPQVYTFTTYVRELLDMKPTRR